MALISMILTARERAESDKRSRIHRHFMIRSRIRCVLSVLEKKECEPLFALFVACEWCRDDCARWCLVPLESGLICIKYMLSSILSH